MKFTYDIFSLNTLSVIVKTVINSVILKGTPCIFSKKIDSFTNTVIKGLVGLSLTVKKRLSKQCARMEVTC